MTFPDRIQDHLIGFKERQQCLPPTDSERPWEYPEISDNLYPPIRKEFLEYADAESIAFHAYARHVRSSQAFGFNLFYPLIKEGPVLAAFPEAIRENAGPVTEWHFEFQPRKNYLGEWAGDQQPIDYITSVDVALFFTRTNGERVAVLCEVKFTETGFSKCGGFSSEGNLDKKFCDGEFSWDHVKNRCYLVSEKGRQYFQLTAGSHTHESTARCPFADNNQCQRNLAFANAIRDDKTDPKKEVYFCLVHHDDNQAIQEAWDQYIALCLPKERERLFRLKASDLVAHSSDETLRRYFEERYQIGSANKGLVRTGDPRTARQYAQP